MTRRSIDAALAAASMLALITGTMGVAAAPRRIVRTAAKHGHVRRDVAGQRTFADQPWPGATTVYGASAPYYLRGPGGGDVYGDDPIGGPDRVGSGGPGAVFGSNFNGLTDAEARRASHWPGY